MRYRISNVVRSTWPHTRTLLSIMKSRRDTSRNTRPQTRTLLSIVMRYWWPKIDGETPCWQWRNKAKENRLMEKRPAGKGRTNIRALNTKTSRDTLEQPRQWGAQREGLLMTHGENNATELVTGRHPGPGDTRHNQRRGRNTSCRKANVKQGRMLILDIPKSAWTRQLEEAETDATRSRVQSRCKWCPR